MLFLCVSNIAVKSRIRSDSFFVIRIGIGIRNRKNKIDKISHNLETEKDNKKYAKNGKMKKSRNFGNRIGIEQKSEMWDSTSDQIFFWELEIVIYEDF